jgi:hypothetical protein
MGDGMKKGETNVPLKVKKRRAAIQSLLDGNRQRNVLVGGAQARAGASTTPPQTSAATTTPTNSVVAEKKCCCYQKMHAPSRNRMIHFLECLFQAFDRALVILSLAHIPLPSLEEAQATVARSWGVPLVTSQLACFSIAANIVAEG